MVEHAEDYEWCSFAAAVKGGEKARRGYAFMYGNGGWEIVRACHEQSMREAMSEILAAREAEKAEAHDGVGGAKPRLKKVPPRSKANPELEMPKAYSVELERGGRLADVLTVLRVHAARRRRTKKGQSLLTQQTCCY